MLRFGRYIPPLPRGITSPQGPSSPFGTSRLRNHAGKRESSPTRDGQTHLWPLPSPPRASRAPAGSTSPVDQHLAVVTPPSPPAMPGEVLEGSGRAILTAEEAAPVEAPPVTLHLLGMVDGAAAGTAFVAASPVGHGGSTGGERFVNGSVLHHPGSRTVGVTGSFQPGLRRSSIGEQAGDFADWLKKSDLPPREKFLCSDQLLSALQIPDRT